MPRVNCEKRASLQAAHEQLHDAYRSIAGRAREARRDATALETTILFAADYEHGPLILARPVDELAATSTDDLKAAGLDPAAVRRLITQRKVAAKLKADTDVLAKQLAASTALMERINAYAHRFEAAQ